MGQESSDVDRFDLGPLLQGQLRIANIKVLIIRLLLVLEVCNVKPTYRKSWAGNLLRYVDRFDLGPLLQGYTMVHWLRWVLFLVDTYLHRFSNA